MKYKGYELDPFQEAAIASIENKHTVIVAAPTGAGKTVIAEYAIEKYLREGRRIIYTAPIKALSNQKHRDFTADYGDAIGIVTGDVSINPQAPVLIMTTEIFRNVTFDDPRRLQDVEYVIFDEIHFINDIQRGTVWEESIIFAPSNINFICLSATIPNLEEFAEWMRTVRPQTTVDVVNETQRPVPLEHHLYLHGYGLGDLKRLEQVVNSLARRNKRLSEPPRGEEEMRDAATRQEIVDLITYLTEAGQLPCLYFCFSRRACEEKALANQDRLLLTPAERQEILKLYDDLCQRFWLTHDRSAELVRELVSHGVAFHHAGLLPTLKEVIERLFTSGLLKLLFTTETFAVGVNMPACTVVFDSLEKFDGVDFRYLKTREYHQMAGRAGRRGIDAKGYVYARVDPRFCDLDEVRRILTGEVEPIESQFNLSYSSLLNLYQTYGDLLFDVCEASFSSFQNQRRLREMEREQAAEVERGKRLPAVDCFRGVPEKIAEYLSLHDQLVQEQGALQQARKALRQRMRHRHQRREHQRYLASLERGVQRLEARLERSPCHGCERYRQCSRRQRQLRDHIRSLALMNKRIEMARNFQQHQIRQRLQLLREFGYIDEKGLTLKGRVAASIYGYELQVTELLFAGLFERLSETEINVVMTAICFESKRTDDYAKIQHKSLQRVLDEARRIIAPLVRRERSLTIEGQLKPLDANLTMAVWAWSEGVRFEELADFTTTPDGDLVRAFRHTVDLLRQARRALEGDPELQDKLQRCIYRLNRDVVDAERQLRRSEERDAEELNWLALGLTPEREGEPSPVLAMEVAD